MKILFIAPLPPPITGQSICSRVLLDVLEESHEVAVVDLSKDSFKEGVDGVKRIFQIVNIFWDVFKKRRKADVIYITISESLAGNIKDLLIYLICCRSLSKMYIHLHGGTIKKLLWDRYKIVNSINAFFIRRMRGAIITGKGHLQVFDEILPRENIHIVPNFAQDYLFIEPEGIERKFNNKPLRILYMSNLIPKKGYNELAEAFFDLSNKIREDIQIDFAGGFESDESKNVFLKKIAGIDNIRYHGVVTGEAKRILFENAHVFCLPTTYFEGQPVSILEAYASGCIVLTTGQSGIYDIFQDKVNGYEIAPQSPSSIKEAIENIIDRDDELKKIAYNNLKTGLEKYRTHIYQKSLKRILTDN